MEITEIKQHLPINTILKHYHLDYHPNHRLKYPLQSMWQRPSTIVTWTGKAGQDDYQKIPQLPPAQ